MSKVYADVVVGVPLPSGKKRWLKVGAMIQMERNDETRGPGFVIMLDKTFNPAGVAGEGASVAMSTYWPKEPEGIPASKHSSGDDDDIPF